MKKWFFAATIVAVALLVLGEMSPAHAGGKGKKCGKGWGAQKPEIDVTSDKDQYYLGDKAHFVVDITLPKCRKMDMYEIYATFPDEITPVELTETNPTQFEYESDAFTEVGSKTLTVRLYHRGTVKAIESLERNAERFRRQIACLEQMLENPELPGWMRNAIEHVIESLKKRLWAVEWIISRLRDMCVAEGGKTIEVVSRPPEAPTGLLCEGEEAPDNVRTRQPHFSAVFIDLDPGDMGRDYQVQVSKDEQFSQIVWDSGKAWLIEFPASGEHCEDIECGVELSDLTEYWWRIKFWDHHGLEGEWSQIAWFKVGDLTPPAPPVMEEQPPEGGILNSSTIHLSGQAEPGATVLVYGSPTLLASVLVNHDGSWDVVLTLPDGAFNLLIFVADPSGNLSPPWTVSFLIDTTPPSTVASPAGGTYSTAVTVELVTTDNLDPSPIIRWTVDGSDPDYDSPVYVQPIEITATATLKFRAVDHAVNLEPVRMEYYDILVQHIYVDGANGDDADDGLAWETAVRTIQKGLDLAGASGWTVLVAPGTYKGVGNRDLDFAGKAVHLRSAGGGESCVIDCENAGRGFYFHSGETSDAVVQGVTVRNGLAKYGGGVLSENSSSPSINGCIIENCMATGEISSSGGGIFCQNSSAVISNCTIANNSATDKGGGIYCDHFAPTIINCSIADNTAWGGGGVFCNGGSAPAITNCVISNNSATQWGGGIFCRASASPVMTNCTIADNAATEYGGGIFCLYSPSLTLNNTILWGNNASSGNEIYMYGLGEASITLNYSDYADNSLDPSNVVGPGTVTPTNCITTDPQFVNASEKNYRVHSASPCIEAGSNSLVPPDLTHDLDGDARITDGDGDQTETVDIGVYEYEPLAVQVATESLKPNNTLAGKSKWFSVDLNNTGEWEIVLTPDSRLEFWDTGFFERKFSTSLAQHTVVKPEAVSRLEFDEAAIPEDLLSGELALRLVAFTTRGYSHDLSVADRLALVPGFVIVDASNSPYIIRGNCDFLDIWVKEDGELAISGSKVFMATRNVTVDGKVLPKELTELTISGNDLTIGDSGYVCATGRGYAPGGGPGAGKMGYMDDVGGGGGASIAQDGENGHNAHGDYGWGGKKHTKERMGSGGGLILAPTSSEGGGSIAIILDGTLTNNGDIDVSGCDGVAVAELHCGSGGGGAGTIFIWADTVTGTGEFVALGGKGGGKGEVTHWGGDGGDGRLEIHYVTALSLDKPDEQIVVGDGEKITHLVTYDEFWHELQPYIKVVFGRNLLAEYKEDGTTPDQERIIKYIEPSYNKTLLQMLVSELQYNIVNQQDRQGMYIDCAKVVEGEFPHLDDIQTKPFLTIRKTADGRVDFDRSVFVATAEVMVTYRGAELGRQEYKFLAGKWPNADESASIIARGPFPHPPARGYLVGLQRAGRNEWTIVTEERFAEEPPEFPVDFDKFMCYTWAVGITTEFPVPPFEGQLERANTYYARYGLDPVEGFWPEAKLFLQAKKTHVGPDWKYYVLHAYAPVGFGYYTSKMGGTKNDPIILHLKEHIDPGPQVKDWESNMYGGTIQSYVPKK